MSSTIDSIQITELPLSVITSCMGASLRLLGYNEETIKNTIIELEASRDKLCRNFCFRYQEGPPSCPTAEPKIVTLDGSADTRTVTEDELFMASNKTLSIFARYDKISIDSEDFEKRTKSRLSRISSESRNNHFAEHRDAMHEVLTTDDNLKAYLKGGGIYEKSNSGQVEEMTEAPEASAPTVGPVFDPPEEVAEEK